MTTQSYQIAKFVATGLGIALCSAETWLNVEFVAHTEGWLSSLVMATVIASVSAAASLPLAERAGKCGQPGKAVGLVIFFLLMAGFSFGASVARTGGKVDGDVNAAQNSNARAQLAKEAYLGAQKAEKDECAKVVGTRCREARKGLEKARNAAMTAPTIKAEDSGADRIAAFLGVPKQRVQLYQPLLLPVAFQIRGFLLLALGFSPGKPEPDVWSQQPPVQEAAPTAIASEAEAHRWMIARILAAPSRKLTASGRELATLAGVAPATFASWQKRWIAEKKIVATRSGNKTIFALPKLRQVA